MLWDFGEGVPSTELNGTHTYGRAGSYRVTLVIWDKNDRGAIEEGSVSIDPK